MGKGGRGINGYGENKIKLKKIPHSVLVKIKEDNVYQHLARNLAHRKYISGSGIDNCLGLHCVNSTRCYWGVFCLLKSQTPFH